MAVPAQDAVRLRGSSGRLVRGPGPRGRWLRGQASSLCLWLAACSGDDTAATGDSGPDSSTSAASTGDDDDDDEDDSGSGTRDSGTRGDTADETGAATRGADTSGGPVAARCGNGRVEGDEDCDDAGESRTCDVDCTVADCGDGVVNATVGEECDDAGESRTCNTNCRIAQCGDGVVNETAGEQCDAFGEDSQLCNADCSEAQCGDGVLNRIAGEDCDDEGQSAECNADCSASQCGDGILNAAASEQCDDGNAHDFDQCDNDCAPAPAPSLDGDHVFDTDAGTLDGVPQDNWDPASARWFLTGLELLPSATLVGVGSNPLQIDVEGSVVVAGTLQVAGGAGGTPGVDTADCETAGSGGLPGPGGFAGGAGAGQGGTGTQDGATGDGPTGGPAGGGVASAATSVEFAGAGGGGGGHTAPGLGGSDNPARGTTGGAGGRAHASLPPVIGGGGGGGGSVEQSVLGDLDPTDHEGAGGGGGGGALWIRSSETITVTGTIDASGGDGGSDNGPGCAARGHGGGGAGGTIRLDAPMVDVDRATLDVSGGLGGTTDDPDSTAARLEGGDGAPGRVLLGPAGFGDCATEPAAEVCLDGETCLVDEVDDPGLGVCTSSGCAEVSDCPPAPLTGDAALTCQDLTGDGVDDCILTCGLFGTCPDGMECFLDLLCAFAP